MSYMRKQTLGRYGTMQSDPPVKPYTFPASVGGVNAVDSLMMMPPQDCIYAYNLMPSEYGQRLRKGYREWATGCVEDPQRAVNVDVRTIIPFESNIQDASNDRLFVVTTEGIWDTTLFNTIEPVQEAVFTQASDPAGYGVWTEFTGDAAGDGLRGHYLFYADGLNGLWQFEEATDAWTQPVSGVLDTEWYSIDPATVDTRVAFPVDNIAFVMVFKQRIWVILEDGDDAYYLPTASVSGELKLFTFGSKMPHGGNLMGLWNWTVDGGDGVDDMMVAIGRGGDVIVYQGEDPEITPDGSSQGPWQTRGTWFVGEIPESRRIVADYGPDLYVLSTYGVTSLNDLLRGNPLTGPTPSRKINRFLRADVEAAKDSNAWQLVVHPGDGFMQIITPKPSQTPYVQYNQNLQTSAWGFWEGVPIFGADSWNGDYFMAGPDGVVYINDGVLDGTEIAKDNHWDGSNPVAGAEWSIPVALEYQCDGTQVAETKYTTDSKFVLVVGTTYQAFYRIKANILVNLFQNVQTVPPGAEWTVPIALEFHCDGTQAGETQYETTLTTPLKAGIRYQVTYKVKNYVAGNHKIISGTTDLSAYAAGDGSFSGSFTPTIDEPTLSLAGDAEFDGTIFDVVVAYYDGAGLHHMEVGGVPVTVQKGGSGGFTGIFTATAADTTISLVGNEEFTGTFFEVGLRVQSSVGEAVAFRALTSFQAPEGHSNFTRVGFIRTIGVLSGVAALNVKAVYDYKIEQQVIPPVQVPSPGQNIWDSAVWDTSLWDFAVEGKSFTAGTLGMGRTFAVAINGNANTRINIVAWDVLFQMGGYL